MTEIWDKIPYKTPQIYSQLFDGEYHKDYEFITELSSLMNKYGIDIKLGIGCNLISEMIRNNIATLYNTIQYNKKI